MKRFIHLVSAMTVLSVIITACNMGKTPPPGTQIPGLEAAAIEPAATEAPAEIATPELVAIDLAGPAMEVGSKYLYIDGSILAAVPGGPFVMGYSYADNPEREVSLGDFWIYSTEVTNQQYALCVDAGKCTVPDPEDNTVFGNYRFVSYPVVGVNHQQAADYCTFVHGRLPTEAEWEKAARGPEGNIFPWGDQSPVCDLLNYNFCKGKTVTIKSYPDGVSFYGLFDMSGNIREWVADWYKSDYFKDGPTEDPLGPEVGQKRSIRSSSFADSADFAISAHRFSLVPDETLSDLGFRCVVDDPTFFAPLCMQLSFVGTGPGGSEAECAPAVQCNDVGVGISQLPCTVGDPSAFTIVNFSVNPASYPDHTKDAPGCVAGPGAMQYTCESTIVAPGTSATITGACQDTATCDPVCEPHYMLVGDSCVWDGSGAIGTECIAGTTYDPVNQCCTATPGTGVDYTVCPDGMSKVAGVCVVDPTGVVDTDSAQITFDSCSPPPDGGDDDDDDDACPVQTCTQGNKWCQSTCSCIYQFSVCP
jgi:formylglycine-generating enzyme required for sulfatase activity